MSRSSIFHVTTVVILVAGCTEKPSTSSDTRVAPRDTSLNNTGKSLASFTHYARAITLTTAKPAAQIGNYTVKLLSIAEDGTTQIQIVQPQQTLTARLGEYFVCREFGERGLTLDSASKASGKVTLVQRSAGSR